MRTLGFAAAPVRGAAAALALLGAIACGSGNTAARDASAGAAVTDTASMVYDATQAIELERGACFGRCPVYTVTVRGDGTVRFAGRAFVADSGLHEASVDAAAIRALFAQFEESPFSTADSAYVEGAPNCGQWFTDAPQLTLRRSHGSDSRSVRLDIGCTGAPRWLDTLAAAVDSTAGTARWITATPSRP